MRSGRFVLISGLVLSALVSLSVSAEFPRLGDQAALTDGTTTTGPTRQTPGQWVTRGRLEHSLWNRQAFSGGEWKVGDGSGPIDEEPDLFKQVYMTALQAFFDEINKFLKMLSTLLNLNNLFNF